MRLRSIIYWIHVCAALGVGAVVLTMSATGVLLAFQRQITYRADTRGLDGGPSGVQTQYLPADSLVARARAAAGVDPTSLRIHSDATAPVELALGRERLILLNGYTGAVLGTGSAAARTFFTTVEDVHRWLALRGDARRVGRAVTGAANLIFLFMVLAGTVLWWPRNRSRRAFRNVLLFRRGLSDKARDFNWHNVIGIWSAVPLLIIITSGIIISYGWAGAVVERLFAGAAPAPASVARPGTSVAQGATEVLLAHARRKAVDWRAITLQLPPRNGVYTVVVDRGTGGQPHRQHELRLSLAGEELSWTSLADEAPAARARSLLRYAHTGEVLGLAGQIVAAAVSAGVLLLGWTGIALALRRFRGWRSRRVASR